MPGVGDERVDLAHRLDRPGERVDHLLLVGDIATERLDTRADRGQLGASLLVLVLVAAPDHDVGTRGGERPGHPQPDAPVPPGHDLDPTRQIRHGPRV